MLGIFSGMFMGIIIYMLLYTVPTLGIVGFMGCGAVLGFVLGIINGGVLALLTNFLKPDGNTIFQYRGMMAIFAVVISDVLTAGAVYAILRIFSVTGEPPNSRLILVVICVATCAAIFNSQLLATSHLRKSESSFNGN